VKRTTKIASVSIFILIGLTIGLFISSNFDIQVQSNAQTKEISKTSSDFLSSLGTALSEISESASPAVVNISTSMTVKMQQTPFDQFMNDPFFRKFFGDQPRGHGKQREYKTSALGSGVIVSDDGYILTNNHVIKDADEIKVLLYDKRELEGKIIGADPKTDLAVIKIDAKDLPILRLGDSDKLKVGSVVMAIGNPYGLNHTITMGIVSAVGRANVGIADYEDFIQTDAAINPGNSGGALVNAQAELVGINTAIFSTSGGYQGIGFAIPSNMAKNVMNSLIENGKVVRGWLGVTIQNLTPDLARHFKIKSKEGVLISDVMEKSPADKGGMESGDLIIKYNGKDVKDSVSLRTMVAQTAPDTKVDVLVIRDEKEKKLTIQIGELPDDVATIGKEVSSSLEGVTVQDITPDIREQLKLPERITGVVITDIAPDSPVIGVLRAGDIVREINRKDISSVKDFSKAMKKTGDEDDILMLIYRNGASIFVTLKR